MLWHYVRNEIFRFFVRQNTWVFLVFFAKPSKLREKLQSHESWEPFTKNLIRPEGQGVEVQFSSVQFSSDQFSSVQFSLV